MLTAIRILLSLPVTLASWLIVLVIRALWGESLTWIDGVAVVRLRATSWPMRSWYNGWGGTTFGHGIMLATEVVLPHELRHVEQLEAGSLTGLAVGSIFSAVGHPIIGAVAWLLVPVLNYTCASSIAVLRGGNAYRDNLYEKAARDATGV